MGELPTEPVTWGATAQKFFEWADAASNLPVLANADTPDQARLALSLGARGIGLCRTEHMFFEKDRIRKFRLMILSEQEERSRFAEELLQFQQHDFVEILKVMDGFSVCIRLLDPPLHEFLPKLEDEAELEALAKELSISLPRLQSRIQQLHETNPMLGHRGCRLGVTFPEIYEIQIRALAEALSEIVQEGMKTQLKIMIPLTMSAKELGYLLESLKAPYLKSLQNRLGSENAMLKICQKLTKWGTMIELPRACLVASEIGRLVDFISFGTNDLTQTTFGISRDDAAKFIPAYIEKGLMAKDPFESLDIEGLGQLIQIAVETGRRANSKLEVGICGEHGGDPESIRFFRRLKFNTVSCSPFRVPIARLAGAQAEIEASGKLRKSGKKRD